MRNHLRLLAVAASCLTIGAAVGASASAIAATGTSTTATGHARHAKHAGLVPRRLAARAVQGDLVVATKHGFVTVTLHRGAVQSVSGQQLTLTEGTKRATYKTVTLTIPANARVRDNGHKAALANLAHGQRATVVQSPKRTLVIARTPRS